MNHTFSSQAKRRIVEKNSLMAEHSIYFLSNHQKHYICTFSKNCSPTLNIFKVQLTCSLTVTEHKTWWTKSHVIPAGEGLTIHNNSQVIWGVTAQNHSLISFNRKLYRSTWGDCVWTLALLWGYRTPDLGFMDDASVQAAANQWFVLCDFLTRVTSAVLKISWGCRHPTTVNPKGGLVQSCGFCWKALISTSAQSHTHRFHLFPSEGVLAAFSRFVNKE